VWAFPTQGGGTIRTPRAGCFEEVLDASSFELLAGLQRHFRLRHHRLLGMRLERDQRLANGQPRPPPRDCRHPQR
jgi:hypothetical protein